MPVLRPNILPNKVIELEMEGGEALDRSDLAGRHNSIVDSIVGGLLLELLCTTR